MTEPTRALETSHTKDKIIVALDVETAGEARAIVEETGDLAGAFKIGLQLFTAAGPEFVRELTAKGIRIFLDLKFHDIPNTVARASIEAARLGVWMFNIHTSGGHDMMKQAAYDLAVACSNENIDRPLLIGVTVLTSSSDETIAAVGVGESVNAQVERLARLAFDAGLDGVVASAKETGIIRSILNPGFVVVTPGIRPNDATNDDQKRVTTPAEAVASGSDYLVIGRPITAAHDRRAAIRKIIEGIESGK